MSFSQACVLPTLVTADVGEESRETLENTLTPQTYETLLEGAHVQIRFKIWEIIDHLF